MKDRKTNIDIVTNITSSKVAIWLISMLMLWSFCSLRKWEHAETKQKLIDWDVTSYYCYLSATFIMHDVAMEFTKHQTDKSYEESHQYWYQIAPNGGRVNKFTMGTAVMYAPFFFMAHGVAPLFHFKQNGFSMPYEFFLALSSIMYVFIGLLYLRKLLLLFYGETVTGITLLCVVLGTNLYYYTSTEPAISHAYSFAVVAAFVYQVIKWHEIPSVKRALCSGLLFGLLVLIRPVNCIIFLLPLLYKVYSNQTFFDKINLFLIYKKQVLIMCCAAFVVFAPQLMYWKWVTGQWFFYSYMEEHFYFNHPHVLLGLFSFRNGWLTYSPVMVFSLLGIIVFFKTRKEFSFALLFFIVPTLFICYSWWTWWYGGSFGSRPMIDSYPLLAIPMAGFFEFIFIKSKKIFVGLTILCTLLISLNLFQTYQRRIGIIHWDAMTGAAYQKVFLKSELSPDDVTELNTLLFHPDYDKAKAGEEE